MRFCRGAKGDEPSQVGIRCSTEAMAKYHGFEKNSTGSVCSRGKASPTSAGVVLTRYVTRNTRFSAWSGPRDRGWHELRIGQSLVRMTDGEPLFDSACNGHPSKAEDDEQ